MAVVFAVISLVILGLLAAGVVMAASFLSNYERKCPKCGGTMHYLGIFGNYVYYKCSKCGNVEKVKYIGDNENENN